MQQSECSHDLILDIDLINNHIVLCLLVLTISLHTIVP